MLCARFVLTVRNARVWSARATDNVQVAAKSSWRLLPGSSAYSSCPPRCACVRCKDCSQIEAHKQYYQAWLDTAELYRESAD